MSQDKQDYPPRAHVVFCDGVRREEGGKVSLMGVYSQVLGFREPRVLMPQFCATFLVDLPSSVTKPTTIRLSLLDRGKPLFAAEVVLDQLPTPMTGRMSAVLPLESFGFTATDGMVLQGQAVIEGVLDYTSDPLVVLSMPDGPNGAPRPQ
ncbi:MAG: hypothetical protein Q7U99_08675 [Rubrivivax sp.]|nr:hypothetical protein [Rubrivivax sp.]